MRLRLASSPCASSLGRGLSLALTPVLAPVLAVGLGGCSIIEGGPDLEELAIQIGEVAAGGDEAEPEAVTEEAERVPPIDDPKPHALVQLGAERRVFPGLISSGEQISLRDGRILRGYRFRRPLRSVGATSQIGDLVMSDGLWYFDRRGRLREVRLWADLRVTDPAARPPDCTVLRKALTMVIGEDPTWEGEGQARWTGQVVQTRWLDTSVSRAEQGPPRCIAEWLDLDWFQGGDGVLWESSRKPEAEAPPAGDEGEAPAE